MRLKDIIFKEIQNEYQNKGYSFRTDVILMNDKLKTELISKAFGVFFIKIINKFEEDIIRIEHSQNKNNQYKFHKSVKNYAYQKDKKGQSKEIYECLNTLKAKYKNNPIIEDIEYFDKYIELTCISETDSDLRIIFKIHPENTKPEFSCDLSMRHYREFFEYTDTVNNTDEKDD